MDQKKIIILLVMMLILSSIIGVVAWGFSTNWWSPDEEGTSGSPGPAKGPGQSPQPRGTTGQAPAPRGTPGQVPAPRGTPVQAPAPRGAPQGQFNGQFLIGKSFTGNCRYRTETLYFVDSSNVRLNNTLYQYTLVTFLNDNAVEVITQTGTYYFIIINNSNLDQYTSFGTKLCSFTESSGINTPSPEFSMTNFINKTFFDSSKTITFVDNTNIIFNGVTMNYRVTSDPLFQNNIIILDENTVIELVSERLLYYYTRFSSNNLYILQSNLFVLQTAPYSVPTGVWPPVISGIRDNIDLNSMGDISAIIHNPLPIGTQIISAILTKANGNVITDALGVWNGDMTKITFRADLTRSLYFKISITFQYNSDQLTLVTGNI